MEKKIKVLYGKEVKDYKTATLKDVLSDMEQVGEFDGDTFEQSWTMFVDDETDFVSLPDYYTSVIKCKIPKTESPIPIGFLFEEKRMILFPKAEIVKEEGDFTKILSHYVLDNNELSAFTVVNLKEEPKIDVIGIGDILHEDPKWEGMTWSEYRKTALMPIISAFPSAMRYFSDFDLFDEDYKILNTFPCPKCGGFYLKDNRGQDGCLDCGHKIQ